MKRSTKKVSNQNGMSVWWVAALTAVLALAGTTALADSTPGGQELLELSVEGKGRLQYALILPKGYEAGREYSAVLALPPGPQTAAMVDAALGYLDGAAERGWIVVSPVAPEGKLFFQGSEVLLPALLDSVAAAHRIAGGKFHVAGVSNGGRSAFRIAGLHPERFHSLTALPGFPPESADVDRLERLGSMPVAMFAGEKDERWVERSERTVERLRELGTPVSFEIFPGEGHVPPSLTPARMLDLLEARRIAAAGEPEAAGAIGAVLDTLHRAAAEADEDVYFGLFAPEAVFFGTDPGERWPLEAFRAWAKPYFQRDVAWAFTPSERHVSVGAAGDTAWFDEIATSEKYGPCRGTGALRLVDGAWKITQYNLTIPVPNDLAGWLLAKIRGEAVATTRVVVVRHAEKRLDQGSDPDLTEEGQARAKRLAAMVERLGVGAAYASQFKRTQQTVEPAARAASVEVQVVDARKPGELAKRIREENAGEVVVVSGHSNTVPAILAALGVAEPLRIDESDYGNLFVVTLREGEPAELLSLRF